MSVVICTVMCDNLYKLFQPQNQYNKISELLHWYIPIQTDTNRYLPK